MKHWKITIIANTFISTYESSCENRDLAIAVATTRILEESQVNLNKIKLEKVIVENLVSGDKMNPISKNNKITLV
jgi:hypothetical protein